MLLVYEVLGFASASRCILTYRYCKLPMTWTGAFCFQRLRVRRNKLVFTSTFLQKTASVGVARLLETEKETDQQLVDQVLEGRVDAFNLLVWRWQRPLYNFLLRLSGDQGLAQDLAQETFLRSYQRLTELREKEKFRSWLFRIAVNLHRSHQRRPRLAVEESAEVDSLSAITGPFRPGARELELTIRSLVGRLAPEHREVVVLRIFHGFQFNEMAEILDCPVSTLKSRLCKAFEELRLGLEEQKRPTVS